MSVPPCIPLAMAGVLMMDGAGVPGQKPHEYCLEPVELDSNEVSVSCWWSFCQTKLSQLPVLGQQFHSPCCPGVQSSPMTLGSLTMFSTISKNVTVSLKLLRVLQHLFSETFLLSLFFDEETETQSGRGSL